MKERFIPASEAAVSKQAEALFRLQEAVAAIHDSDSFRRYLAVQARFHHYSWGNALLIMAQRPDATRVAGFRAWQQLGRVVKKGERGIAILVPHRRRSETETGEDEQTVTGFGVGHVFDIAQTDGNELPRVEVPVLTGEQGKALYGSLADFAQAEGVRVLTVLPGQLPQHTMGYYLPQRREIVLGEYSQRQMTKTLAHELGHHVHLSRFGAESQELAERETVAESVAFVVAAHYGLDTGERSFPYIATWSQDQARFRGALATIQKVAGVIIDGVERIQAARSDEPQEPGTPREPSLLQRLTELQQRYEGHLAK